MKFSGPFLDTLRQRLLLSHSVASYTPLKKKGNDFSGLCPFHKEKTPSFTVNDSKGFYHCFGCGAHGDIISFVQQMRSVSFPEAVEYLADLAGLPLPQVDRFVEGDTFTDVKNALTQAAVWFEKNLYQNEGHVARTYLLQRGLTEKTWRAFNMGWAPGGNALSTHLTHQGFSNKTLQQAGLVGDGDSTYDRFRNRIIFPIKNMAQKVIGFGGRLIGEGHPKYLNSPETVLFKKGENLYNFKHFQEKTPVVVVEGYLDVISLHQAGFTTAVAPLGTALTEKQIQLLWQKTPEPLICFDGDQAGRLAAERTVQRVLPLLKSGCSLNFVFLSSGLDPDSFIHQQGIDAWATLVKTPLPLHTVLWDIHQQHYKKDTPERFALSKKMLKKTIAVITDADIRQSYNHTMEKNWQDERKNLYPQFFKKDIKAPPVVHTLLNSNVIQQRILLAVPVIHPEILPDIFELLATLHFPLPQYTAVQQAIVFLYTNTGILDKDELKTHLTRTGYEKAFDELVASDLLVHAAFSSPKSSTEQALQGWNETLRWYQNQCLLNEQMVAATELGEDLTPKTWERLKNLKHLALQAVNKN